jgi:hypothetical protein
MYTYSTQCGLWNRTHCFLILPGYEQTSHFSGRHTMHSLSDKWNITSYIAYIYQQNCLKILYILGRSRSDDFLKNRFHVGNSPQSIPYSAILHSLSKFILRVNMKRTAIKQQLVPNI